MIPGGLILILIIENQKYKRRMGKNRMQTEGKKHEDAGLGIFGYKL